MILIADCSALIALASCDGLPLLDALFARWESHPLKYAALPSRTDPLFPPGSLKLPAAPSHRAQPDPRPPQPDPRPRRVRGFWCLGRAAVMLSAQSR
jgi:hypothetical protein